MENIPKEMKTEGNSISLRENKIGKILICFSAYTNTRKIFNIKLDADQIPVIHGLRVLSMYCTIISHIIYFTLDFLGE